MSDFGQSSSLGWLRLCQHKGTSLAGPGGRSDLEITAKELFYRSLKQNNVSDAFIYSGGSIMPLIDSLYGKDIKYYQYIQFTPKNI